MTRCRATGYSAHPQRTPPRYRPRTRSVAQRRLPSCVHRALRRLTSNRILRYAACFLAGAVVVPVLSFLWFLCGSSVLERVPAGEVITTTLACNFEGREMEITARCSQNRLKGDRFLSPNTYGLTEPRVIRMAVESARRDLVVRSIAAEARRRRNALGLDDDSFVELLAELVQEIPYRGNDGDRLRLPNVVVMDRGGDCLDKSVVLAALLQECGFGSAVLLFDDEEHAVAGVRSERMAYGNTPYALIETTSRCYIGQVPYALGPPEGRSTPTVVDFPGSDQYVGDRAEYLLAVREASSHVVGECPAGASSASLTEAYRVAWNLMDLLDERTPATSTTYDYVRSEQWLGRLVEARATAREERQELLAQ